MSRIFRKRDEIPDQQETGFTLNPEQQKEAEEYEAQKRAEQIKKDIEWLSRGYCPLCPVNNVYHKLVYRGACDWDPFGNPIKFKYECTWCGRNYFKNKFGIWIYP